MSARARLSLAAALVAGLVLLLPLDRPLTAQSAAPRVTVTLPTGRASAPQDGRLLLLVSTDSTREPRFQIADGPLTQLVFGMDVTQWAPGTARTVDGSAAAYPLSSLRALPPGRYWVQALLNRYQTFRRADGHVVSLPPDRGEGQQWQSKPGNYHSVPRWVTIDGRTTPSLALTEELPAIAPPTDSKYVKHLRIRSERLSKFWGTDVFLGAHVLLPEGFDTHPNARYPLVVYHGHFPADLGGFRTTPPDPSLVPDSSTRFRLKGYNRIQQELAYQFHKDWTGPGFPRVLVIEIQHPTPYYDDSYAVNSENNGPYGDAIMYELIPEIERRFRGIGQGYARFAYGGSTGGWEAMAVQVFYPDEFNGVWAACPDPIDFRAFTVVDLTSDTNAYWLGSRWKRTPRAGMQDYLGRPTATMEEVNRHEAAIASKGRSGGQWDIWQAVYSPVGPDGYPKPIWDKATGRIDAEVARHWRERYDLVRIVTRDWATLGPKLRGKLHIYVGDMDNYWLQNAVYLAERDFAALTNPPADAEFAYGDRAEHCWNGDPYRGNAYSRLRYHQMFIPRIMDQIRKRHPAGVDTLSWRY
ncbi:MAG: hypothetical protein MUE41_03970 [Gemmatimonadaceae bacterium]|nr:hypothetical protein [Gemmatimonadaceae bacterium]